MNDIYPTEVAVKHTERIDHARTQLRVDSQVLIQALKPHELWPFQRAFAELEFSMLQFLIANGKAPVRPASFDIIIEVKQDAVSDVVTDAVKGRYEMPYEDSYLTWTEFNVGNAWLPLTDKEKSYGS